MHLKIIAFIVGVLIFCIGITMLVPLGVSIHYDDGASLGIGQAMALTTCIGILLIANFYKDMPFYTDNPLTLNHREGLAIVGLCWFSASLAGGLPFIFGADFKLIDAFFESASGFTTTGSTILTSIQTTPKGLLMWRSLTHWIGGMGIIVLSLAILPFLGVGGMQLYKAEVPGPNPDKLTPRMRDTAMLLWKVYVLLTVVQICLLLFGDMNLFDAVNHAFATMATGGFSTRDASVGAFNAYSQWVIIIFMFLAGINFTLHYRFLIGNVKIHSKDTECLTYAILISLGILIICLSLFYTNFMEGKAWEIESTIRAAAFQVVSICTTTGFGTADFELWPYIAQAILVFFMFMGGSAGSTSGGLKTMRIVVLAKVIWQELFKIVHPHAITHAKLNGRSISSEILSGVIGFFLLYMLLLGIMTAILSTFNIDLLTAFTATLTCLSNVGPGLGSVGPAENFAHLAGGAKAVLILCMLLGRLEFYAILVLFLPEYWKK